MKSDFVKCPMLSELPAPPVGKRGWPWTEESSFVPPVHFPCTQPSSISIVVPNFNYAGYLEETLRSILLQGYPRLQLIVLDGGSTDGSVEIIKKYEKWISYWTSGKDGGQSSAINAGLKLSKGDIFNWINSDDLLVPNCFWMLSSLLSNFPEFRWISGTRMMINAQSQDLYCEMIWVGSITQTAFGFPNLPQDATFFRTSLISEMGGLREDLSIGFDTILNIATFLKARPLLTRCVFSKMRLHREQKSKILMNVSEATHAKIQPVIDSLPLRSRLCHKLCYGKAGPLLSGIFEQYRQWVKGDLLLNEAYFDLEEMRWKVVKR
jgi:hypothetical protein